ncbi:MAG: entry exclusion 1 domain-containing protein [Alphaproteobacteria bacterium]
MAKVGAQRAAVLTGKSKSTIQRAMNSGKLSFQLDQNGRRVIDVSELERVFGIKKQTESAAPAPEKVESVSSAVEKERMEMEIKMLKQQVDTSNEIIDDLKDQRDKWERQASQVLITSQYSQKQAEELRAQIKEREERARQRRLQNAKMQQAQAESKSSTPQRELSKKVKKLEAQNENVTEQTSVFSFWKKAKG